MRLLVLSLALAALAALATPASIPHTADAFEKKLQEAVQEVLDKDAQIPNSPSEQEINDQSNTIKDVDNQLLKQVAAEAIPVKVVVEDAKIGEKDEKPDDADIKRVEVDLKHPGEPQRQEHETQNPEHYEHEQGTLASIKQMIRDTQVVFNDGFKDVSQHIEDWLTDNKPEVSIRQSIEHLQETFMDNIHKLNSTIQSYWNQGATEIKDNKVNLQVVQTELNALEQKFESGVQTLNNGVRNLAVQKSGARDDATTTTKPSGIQFPGFVTNFWTTMTQSFGNVTNQFQNIIGQSNSTAAESAGTQSDDTSASISKPSVWQGIQNQIQGIFQNRPGQNQQGVQNDEQPAQPSGPFAQVIQSVPLLQNFVNLIQPKPPQAAAPAPASAPSEPAPSTNSEGSNVVPAPDPAKPTDQQQKKPDKEIQPAQASNPIQQIIQKNPIVQGIAGAVQKIQHTISNPEKPREEKEGNEKGGFYSYGHRPGNDNNNDGGSGLAKSAPAEDERPVEAAAAAEAKIPAPAAAEAEKTAPAIAEAVKTAPAIAEIDKTAPAIVEAEKSGPACSAPVEAERPASAPASPEAAVKKD